MSQPNASTLKRVEGLDFEKATRGRIKNARVGTRPGPYAVRCGFRSVDDTTIVLIKRWYRSGFFTQAELSQIFHMSVSMVNKAVRVQPAAGETSRGGYRESSRHSGRMAASGGRR